MSNLNLQAVVTVLVLLEGLTADGKSYNEGDKVPNPGPQLMKAAQPDTPHWLTGKQAAEFLVSPEDVRKRARTAQAEPAPRARAQAPEVKNPPTDPAPKAESVPESGTVADAGQGDKSGEG